MSNLARLPQQPAVSGNLVIRDIEDLSRLSAMLAASGYFSDAKDAAQAGVKVLCGLELGLPAIAAMSGIYLVKGKPTLSANLMAAAVKRSGKYNYRVLQHTDSICEIAFFEKGQEIGRSVFTAEDAKRAGTQNMDKFPKNMIFARAISNGVRFHCPDVFLGPVYVPEELNVPVTAEGEPISTTEITVEAAPKPNGNGQNHSRITAVMDLLEIPPEAQPLMGKQAIESRFPGRKSSSLGDEETTEVIQALLLQWGENTGIFSHRLHCLNAFNKLKDDLNLEDADDFGLAGCWKEDIERRQREYAEEREVATP